MVKCDFKKPYAREWRVLYRAAIFSESNDHKLVTRISDAEDAIVERMRELLHDTGADALVERDDLNEAMYALKAWETALQNRTHAA
jgi:hypothetical protein